MTVVGGGGLVIRSFDKKKKFEKDYQKLPPQYQALFKKKLEDMLASPRPPGLRFEKLKGYRRPDIYTIHLDGNYKVSFEMDGDCAVFRAIGNHNYIDRKP